jgi:hypothetical protein
MHPDGYVNFTAAFLRKQKAAQPLKRSRSPVGAKQTPKPDRSVRIRLKSRVLAHEIQKQFGCAAVEPV